MHFSRPALVAALATAAAAGPIADVASKPSFVTVPVEQHLGSGDVVQQSLAAYGRRARATNGKAAGPVGAPETLDAGFWFGSFTVGNSQNLSLLIDTGSADVAVNPGKYKASSASKDGGRNGELRYITAQANGCGDADISYHTYSDTVSFQGLTAKNQVFGNIKQTTPPDNNTITVFPHDGIVGFLGTSGADTQIGGTPFFQNLCNQNAVSSCRFGLAYGTNGKGSQILGGTDSTLYSGSLSTASIRGQWELPGSLTVGGTSYLSGLDIILDSGTANIVGSNSQVQSLFNKLGIQSSTLSLPGCSKTVVGYYPCDKPPTVGFQFGSSSKTPNFNVEPGALKLSSNGNNCTIAIAGLDVLSSGQWIVGQNWMQGKYVDHNAAANTLGFATLKNKTP